MDITRKSGKNKRQIFFLIIIFGLAIGFIPCLRADTSVRSSFAVELKEWLVLEIKSRGTGFSDTGNLQALGQLEIVPGQPLQVRAILSVRENKTIVLKGIVYSEGKGPENLTTLIWRGEGDLQGEGLVISGLENTFAVWQGNGLKSGSLVFLEPEGNSGHTYKVSLTLSAL